PAQALSGDLRKRPVFDPNRPGRRRGRGTGDEQRGEHDERSRGHAPVTVPPAIEPGPLGVGQPLGLELAPPLGGEPVADGPPPAPPPPLPPDTEIVPVIVVGWKSHRK